MLSSNAHIHTQQKKLERSKIEQALVDYQAKGGQIKVIPFGQLGDPASLVTNIDSTIVED